MARAGRRGSPGSRPVHARRSTGSALPPRCGPAPTEPNHPLDSRRQVDFEAGSGLMTRPLVRAPAVLGILKPEFEAVRRTRLHEKVAKQIERLIVEGGLTPGDKLPPERELCVMFRASRERSLQFEGRLEKSFSGHQQILRAIKRHDAPAAERAMRQHLEKIEEIILKKL